MKGNKSSIKHFAILFALCSFIFYQFSTIYVPENFERPIVYKLTAMFLKVLGASARFIAMFNIGNEPQLWRLFLTKSSSFLNAINLPSAKTKIEDITIAGVNTRLHTPSFYFRNGTHNEKLPLMIFMHGGAYVIGDVDSYDSYLSELAEKARLKIISIDYEMAPESPLPRPIEDCFKVVEFLIEFHRAWDYDVNRLILAGDSAGGNAVAVISQRLAKHKYKIQPKLQILIYPWLQMYNFFMPSSMHYAYKSIISFAGFKFPSYICWLNGVLNMSDELHDAIFSNEHQLLIEDEKLREKYQSYLDISLIPDKYKHGRSYYDDHSSQDMLNFKYPRQINSSHIFKRDIQLGKSFLKFVTPEISPALAADDILALQPKTYFILFEWDTLKDEGLIYAERLRRNGVDVKIAFYEDVFHGIVPFISGFTRYDSAQKIFDDLVFYLHENV